MAETVLIVSGPDDPTARAVADALDQRHTRYGWVDTGDFPQSLTLAAVSEDGDWSGRLVCGQTAVDLEEVSAVYYRRPTRFRFPDALSDGDVGFAYAEARLGLGGVLASLDALWVNDPMKVAVAEYKPLQLRTAARAGLRTPRTLVTNDHAAVMDFAGQVGGELVCKQLSAVALHDDGELKLTYTTKVDVSEVDPAAVAVTATQFQELIWPKAYEARVTMVGRRPLGVGIFAGNEESGMDWRADYSALTYMPIEPPVEVTEAMCRYLDAFGLTYAAFDFVITPDSEWIFLEANAMGQWLWLQHDVGVRIAEAFADLLTEGITA